MSSDIFDIPLSIPQGGLTIPPAPPLAAGLRLSTDCVSKRFIEEHEPERYFAFNEGVGALGHLLAGAWISSAFHDVKHHREYPLPWAWGISHIDCVIPEGTHKGCYEIKTTSKDTLLPTEQNRRQVKRMLRAAERASIDLPEPFRIVIIGKAGTNSGWVRGPWTVTLTDEDRVWIDGEFDLIDKWQTKYPNVDTWGDEFEEACTCGQCVPPPVEVLEGRLRAFLDHDYYAAMDEAGFWKKELEAARASVEEQCSKLTPGVYESERLRLRIKDDHKLIITKRKVGASLRG